ncbi:TPA: hypothetical protein DEP90_00900 [Patescibacteria group bacterium]|nr:hypothetical protein [Patescibacteria group bacterium]
MEQNTGTVIQNEEPVKRVSKKEIILISLIVIFLLTSLVLGYLYLMELNEEDNLSDVNINVPVEDAETSENIEVTRFDDGTIATKTAWEYSPTPTVKATASEGWELKTKIYEKISNFATEIPESEMIIGDVSFQIFKGNELVAFLSYVTDTGGAGGIFYNFPDSDPEIYESMLEKSEEEDSSISVVEVDEGEYSLFNLFGLEVRRVGNVYMPNVNEKDTYYFTNPLDPIMFYFGQEGPQYEVYYNGEKNDSEVKYMLRVSTTEEMPSEEDLLIVDSILESFEIE